MTNRVLGLALLLSGLGSVVLAQDTVTASYNGYPVPIMPDYWDTISVATITVPKALKITKVTAKINISYPQIGDLNIFLYSPDGTRTKLLEHNCGEKRIIDATFDDAIERLVFLAKIDAGLAELDQGKGIPHEEVKRRLGL